ncbi:MAG: hypothetical protein VW475_14535, partial [Curvibacter sp.]
MLISSSGEGDFILRAWHARALTQIMFVMLHCNVPDAWPPTAAPRLDPHQGKEGWQDWHAPSTDRIRRTAMATTAPAANHRASVHVPGLL